jgi:hypothetical protein
VLRGTTALSDIRALKDFFLASQICTETYYVEQNYGDIRRGEERPYTKTYDV